MQMRAGVILIYYIVSRYIYIYMNIIPVPTAAVVNLSNYRDHISFRIRPTDEIIILTLLLCITTTLDIVIGTYYIINNDNIT